MTSLDERIAAIRAARVALEAHQGRRGISRPDLQDCLTDLFHLAEHSGMDVEEITKSAVRSWRKERCDP